MNWHFFENMERGLDGFLLAFDLMTMLVGCLLLGVLLAITLPLWLPIYLLGLVMQRVEK